MSKLQIFLRDYFCRYWQKSVLLLTPKNWIPGNVSSTEDSLKTNLTNNGSLQFGFHYDSLSVQTFLDILEMLFKPFQNLIKSPPREDRAMMTSQLFWHPFCPFTSLSLLSLHIVKNIKKIDNVRLFIYDWITSLSKVSTNSDLKRMTDR